MEYKKYIQILYLKFKMAVKFQKSFPVPTRLEDHTGRSNPLPIPFPEVCPRTCATINSLQEGKLRWPVAQNRELGVMASYRKLLQYSSFHFQINSRICLPAYNKVSWVLYNLNIIPVWSNWCSCANVHEVNICRSNPDLACFFLQEKLT
jgi:hypothetical protein